MLTMLKSLHWAKVCVSYIQIFLTCVVNSAFKVWLELAIPGDFWNYCTVAQVEHLKLNGYEFCWVSSIHIINVYPYGVLSCKLV